MNSALIEMTIVGQPESRFTQGGSSQKQIGVAIAALQWEKNGEDFAQLIKVTAWRDVDAFLTLQEGDSVLFDGSIKLNTVDKGAYKAKVAELNCNSFQRISAGTGSPQIPKSSVTKTPVAAIAPTVSSSTDEVPDYSDIPF